MSRTIGQGIEEDCLRLGKTALLFSDPNTGGHLLYVSAREVDVLSACMSACIDIMLSRYKKDGTGPIKIEKIADLVLPGHQYHWSVHNEHGVEKSGYAASQEECKEKIAAYMLAKQSQLG